MAADRLSHALTADAALAAAPTVGDEEAAPVAAVSEGARLWSEWFLFSVPVGGHGYPYKGDHRGVVAGIDALIVERDQLRTRLAEALDAYQSDRDAMQAECERLEAECQELADKGDGANLRHAQLWARCERAERERDEARAAGRDLLAENAALRSDREWWRNAARQLAANVMRMAAAFDAAVAENARGGVLERGKDGRGAAE